MITATHIDFEELTQKKNIAVYRKNMHGIIAYGQQADRAKKHIA